MDNLIAIIEDEPDIAELISMYLQKAGFKTKEFYEAKNFYRFLQQKKPNLVILDLMLPDIDGIEVCKYLRGNKKYSDTPIIMVTARTDEIDKVLGLELGADDYITKPFSPRELVARVKAVLRRNNIKDDTNKIRVINNILKIDLYRYEVYVGNKKINLTSTEFKILELLSSKKGWAFSRDQLLDYLWGDEKIVVDRTIDVHIRHIRDKLGNAGKFIKNIRGLGYKLEQK